MRRTVLLLLVGAALVPAACQPNFKEAARRLAADPYPDREPIPDRRRTYFDREATRLRSDLTVLILRDGSTVKHGRELVLFKDGQKQLERHWDLDRPTGEWRTWYANGQLRSFSVLGTEDARPMQWWHENGQLSTEGMARDGIREGLWTSWHPNGVKASEGRFRQSLRHGPWTTWHPDGSLHERGEYRDGLRIGAWEKHPPPASDPEPPAE